MLSKNVQNNYYPISHPQKRIWYNEQLYPNTVINHICGIGEIIGKVKVSLLLQSIQAVIRKHQAFQLVVSEQQDNPVQYLSQITDTSIEFIDFRSHPDSSDALNHWIEKQINKSLPMNGHPHYYFAVYQIRDNHFGIFAKLHHLIFDGWSMRLLTNEISNNYEKLACGDSIEINDSTSYTDFIERENKYLTSKRAIKDRSYWLDKFDTIPEPIFHSNSFQLQAKRKSYSLDKELTSSIHKWVKDNNCSVNDFFLLLINLYLHKIHGKREFTIFTPVYNRSSVKEKQTIGMFTSTIPLLFNIDPNSTILEMLSSIKKEVRNTYLHQRYPYDLLIQKLQKKQRGNDSLFQLSVNYYPFTPSEEISGSRFELTELHPGQQAYPLQIIIKEWEENQLALEFDYKTSIFKEVEIDNMYSRLLYIARNVIENQQLMIKDIQMLTDEERFKLLVEYNKTTNDYPKNKTVIDLFEEQVKLNPERIALSCNSTSYTYQELHQKVCTLANKLSKMGIGIEKRVGIYGTHSIELVVGMLAILKAGAAYIPLDYSYPIERVAEIVQDSCLSCIVANEDLPEKLQFGGQILYLTDLKSSDGDMVLFDHSVSTSSHDLAYMIYTSGSTGKPKGVMIEHSSLTNYCLWANKVYVQEAPAVFAFYSSISFDLTVTSIFTPLIGGHEIRIYKEPEDGFVLFDILDDNKVTVLKLTPAHLSVLQNQLYKNSSIQTLVVGGENLKVATAYTTFNQFERNIKICNEYGPTEATVGCMIHTYDPEKDTGISVPIGKPADNVRLYVLDEQLNPVPVGSVGELYISGDGLARGYWNREDLTKSSFLPNPQLLGERMYKTGDLVRFMENGLLEYIERKDHQVKINGYRIELTEIEVHLCRLTGVTDARVLDWNLSDGRKQLCAYLVMKEKIDVPIIKEKLSESLPDYMIPVHYILVDEMPLTKNGKVDRSRLPEPVFSKGKLIEGYELSKEESVLVDTFQNLLSSQSIGVAHDFFELGGDSIKAIQLSSRLKNLGYNLKTKDILANPRIDIMATYMTSNEHLNLMHEQEKVEGVLQKSPIHSWFFGQKFAQPEYYFQSVMLQIDESVNCKDIELAIQQLIRHHDSLRLNLSADGELYFNPKHLETNFYLEAIDLSGLSYDRQLKKIADIGGEVKSGFDLKSDLLIKARYFNLGTQGTRLFIVAHHLVVDAVSWRILLEDLARILEGKKRLAEIELPTKMSSYQKWTRKLNEYAAQSSFDKQCYWNKVTEHANQQVSGEASEQIVLMKDTLSTEKKMSRESTQQWLLHTKAAYQTEPVELLIASLALTMKQLKGNHSVIMQMEGHGREEFNEEVDVSRTVGWFTSIFPVLLDVPDTELSEQIKHIKEQLRQVPNKGFDYLIKRYLSNQLSPVNSENQMIRFNYLGDTNGLNVPGVFTLADEKTGPDHGLLNHFNVLLDFNVMVLKGELHLTVTYGLSQFSEEWITKFMDIWVEKLIQIVEHCTDKNSTDYTPSDFDTVTLDQEELDLILLD